MRTPQFTSSPLCLLALIAAAATLTCGTATAGDPNAAPHRVVSFGDLNLNHADGVKVLYSRLSAAARAVCGSSSYPYMLRAESRKCVRTSLANAIAAIDNPNLTAFADNRTNGSNVTGITLASRR